MIRILPLKLPERQMFCLYEDIRLLAKCNYSEETGEILGLEVLDEKEAGPWYTAMIKATMSSMEYAGVEIAWSRRSDLFPLLRTLRFEEISAGKMQVSLKGYFDGACECSQCNHCGICKK